MRVERRQSGAGVRIAVIDSGVHVGHPHVGSVAGGVGLDDAGDESDDYVDRLGHGTAVMAAIKEKAPDAALFAVRVFDRQLSTSIERLVRAIDWAIRARMNLVNLSLGTRRAEHRRVLTDAVARAARAGVVIVAASEADEDPWLPGSLDGVLPVRVDWECPRDCCRVHDGAGRRIAHASGYPRDIPGVPREFNLQGTSFAVANVTGLAAVSAAALSGSSRALLEALARPHHA
jgi:subtilisin family serine protease